MPADASTKGALRVVLWSGVVVSLFLAISVWRYTNLGPIHLWLLATFLLVFAVLAFVSARQLMRLDQSRSRKAVSGLPMLLAGVMAAILTLLGHFGIVPGADFYLGLGLVLWMTAIFFASLLAERRHQVRLYYALDGLIVSPR